MIIENLNDLKPGDVVAYRHFDNWPWWQDEVSVVTERYIVIKSVREVTFEKNNGLATKKEGSGYHYQIACVTPEIQEQWDKLFYKDKLQACLLETKNSESTDEALTSVFNLLVSQTKWEQREQRTAIFDILLKLKHLSSDTLKQAIAILEEQLSPKH